MEARNPAIFGFRKQDERHYFNAGRVVWHQFRKSGGASVDSGFEGPDLLDLEK